MKKLNQKGFTPFEIIILILLFLILLLVGWWVWQQQKENKPSGDSGQQQAAEKKEEKKEEEKPKETPKKYLEIKELGVKIELDDNTTDAYYVMQNGYAYVSTTALKNASAECAAEKTGVVAVSKAPKTEEDPMMGKTYEQYIKDGGSGTIIGNNAYLVTRSQAYCSEQQAIKDKQQAAWDSFLAKSKTLQAL